MNKTDLIRTIVELSDEGILDKEETIDKIKMVLRQQSFEDETETPEMIKRVIRTPGSKLRGHHRFTPEEDQFLSGNYNQMTTVELGRRLGRSVHSVRQRVKRLKLSKRKIKAWKKVTPAEDNFISKNMGKMSISKIGQVLNRSDSAIMYRIKNFIK